MKHLILLFTLVITAFICSAADMPMNDPPGFIDEVISDYQSIETQPAANFDQFAVCNAPMVGVENFYLTVVEASEADIGESAGLQVVRSINYTDTDTDAPIHQPALNLKFPLPLPHN